MKLEVLISCMGNHKEVIAETGLRSDALVIDQCDSEREEEFFSGENRIRILETKERGLSNSRNMAIRNATGDVVLLCDDDESLEEDYPQTILRAYENLPDADIIAFRIKNQPSRLKQNVQRLNKWTALRISSWQITFKPKVILEKGLSFDPLLGAGSGNGASEEVHFLRQCIKAGCKAYYVPEDVASVAQESSTWFTGFDQKFFYQRGTVNRYMLGLPVSLFYALYYTAAKRNLYRNDISSFDALKYTLKGIISNDIEKEKKKRK